MGGEFIFLRLSLLLFSLIWFGFGVTFDGPTIDIGVLLLEVLAFVEGLLVSGLKLPPTGLKGFGKVGGDFGGVFSVLNSDVDLFDCRLLGIRAMCLLVGGDFGGDFAMATDLIQIVNCI